MGDPSEDRLELPVAPIGRRARGGRWTPVAWVGVLALVAAFAIAGQRGGDPPAAVTASRVAELTPRPTAAPSAVAIVRVPPPWVTDRRTALRPVLGSDGAMGSLTQGPLATSTGPRWHFYARSLTR